MCPKSGCPRKTIPNSRSDILANLNTDIIKAAYGWTIDIHGELHGLVAGDMGYEPTGIKLDGVTLEIWELGIEAWQAKTKKPDSAASN